MNADNKIQLSQIDVPLPFPPRMVHVYVITYVDSTILVDLGPNTPEAWKTLTNGLKKIGLSVEDVTHVVFTHSHVDHAGMAETFREYHSTVKMYLHQREWEYFRYIRQQKWERHFEIFGSLEPEMLELFRKWEGYYRKMKTKLEPTDLFQGTRATLEINGMTLEIHHVPGHTPGSIVLYLPSEKILLAGDHVLAHISPIISYSDFEHDGLGLYLSSLRKLLNLRVKEAWPAHGARILDFELRIKELLRHHDARLREVYRVVKKMKKPIWPLELVSELFEPNLPLDQHPLAFFEVLAHLIHLQRQGLLEFVPGEGWISVNMK